MQVALLFITRGEMPYERMWAAWLAAAKWLVPAQHANAFQCEAAYKPPRGMDAGRLESKSGRQHYEEQALFSIYVHSSPNFTGYAADSVFAGKTISERVEVKALPPASNH